MTRVVSKLVLLSLVAALGCGDSPLDTSAHAATGDAGVVETGAVQTAVRVQVAPTRRGVLARGSRATGVAYADRTADVAAEIAGRVVERRVEAGARVERGDVLVALDATNAELAVAEAAATLEARRVDLAEARKELGRSEALVARGARSESQHDTARFAVDRARSAHALAKAALGRAQKSLDDATVRAPFAGTVESVAVDVGDYAQPGAPIARIADFSRVRVRAGLTAAEAADVETGQRAVAEFSDLGGERAEGLVQSVGRIADRSGTYSIEIWLETPDPRLREGMVAQVEVHSRGQEQNLLVPRSALLRRNEGLSVFVVEEANGGPIARAQRVRVGRSSHNEAEIVGGLEEGQRVVTGGLFALRDGAAITIDRATRSASAEGE